MPERSRPGDALGVGLGAAPRAAATHKAKPAAKARPARGRGRGIIFSSLNRRVGLPFSHASGASTSAPRAHEIDESAVDIHADELHAELVAQVRSLLAVQELALDRRAQDSHPRSLV